jgi:hypothetical protein
MRMRMLILVLCRSMCLQRALRRERANFNPADGVSERERERSNQGAVRLGPSATSA